MIKTSAFPYHGDGLRMIGYFAIDDAGPSSRPAFSFAPEAPGLDELNPSAALAWRARTRNSHSIFTAKGKSFTDRGRLLSDSKLFMEDPMRTRSRAQAALSVLRAQRRRWHSGCCYRYCFGGT